MCSPININRFLIIMNSTERLFIGHVACMDRAYRKASTHQIGTGNNYVGPLQRQEKQRWADCFYKLVGSHRSKVARDRNEWKVLENQLKGTNKLSHMNKFQNAVNHSRGLAQRENLY